MADVLRKVLAERDADGKLNREKVAATIIERAVKGDTWAIHFIYDRLDGRIEDVPTTIDAGDGGIRIHTVTAIIPPRKSDDS